MTTLIQFLENKNDEMPITNEFLLQSLTNNIANSVDALRRFTNGRILEKQGELRDMLEDGGYDGSEVATSKLENLTDFIETLCEQEAYLERVFDSIVDEMQEHGLEHKPFKKQAASQKTQTAAKQSAEQLLARLNQDKRKRA